MDFGSDRYISLAYYRDPCGNSRDDALGKIGERYGNF